MTDPGRVPWVLVFAVLLTACATGAPPHHSSEPRRPAPVIHITGDAVGGSGGPADTVDSFHRVQEASGLGDGERHPAGAALDLDQARSLLGSLARTPVTPGSFAPRRVLFWLLHEVLAGGERVEYADLKWRAERFGFLVLMRPDGYLVTALTGTPLQRLGPLRLVKGEWTVGRLTVGAFYYSRSGVFYPVTEALRREDGPPLGELGLGRDPLNAALDGAQEAVGEMAAALAESILHPIRTVEDLAQLPTTVAHLIASSPEYFARYGAMSREDQIREAARLSTHVLSLLGGAEASVGRMGRLGAEAPVLSLTARGELMLGGVAVEGSLATSAGSELGVPSVLHMAVKGPGKTGGAGGQQGNPAQTATAQGPGKWTYKKPTTDSESALDYQEQITGRPAWWVYMIGRLEFDGIRGRGLLEAKGPGYCSFFKPDGTPQAWYRKSGKLGEMMDQARRQSAAAKRLGLSLTWHVADVNVANFLRDIFKGEGWDNITVRYTPASR